MKPEVILGYAIYDAENTDRLSEHPEAQEAYFQRAKGLLWALGFRTKKERKALARVLRKMPE